MALGAFLGVRLTGYDNNVYVQVGLVMLIGLAAKNAILIVEFAKAKHEQGSSLEESALESARLRFRPILMTAFAFILGVVPLMLASGAGSGAQNVMGTAVFWGMLIATALGVFIIPGNFTFVEGLGRKRSKTAATARRWQRRASGPWRRDTYELESISGIAHFAKLVAVSSRAVRLGPSIRGLNIPSRPAIAPRPLCLWPLLRPQRRRWGI